MYPTKEQILKKPVLFKKEAVDAVLNWKAEYYKDGKWQAGNKNDAINMLIKKLADVYNSPVNISMEPGAWSCYQQEDVTIILDSQQPSILTALHEFGHHLKGSSELQACRWSVWLFIKCFPKSYEKLAWRDHMLVKKDGP